MANSLDRLREHLKNGDKLVLKNNEGQSTDDITKATMVETLSSDGSTQDSFPLNEETEIEIDRSLVQLRIIVHCWMNKDSSAADYLADCQNKQLTNVSFLQRTDLINWLSGNTESSQYLKAPGQKGETSDKVDIENKTLAGELSTVKSTTSASHENDSEVSDPVVVETMKHERILVDHNSALRGAKPINFGYLIKDAELKLVQSIKGSLRGSKLPPGHKDAHGRISKTNGSSGGPRKDPIILIPSAASSILTVANIKQFLLESKYVNPRNLPSVPNGLVNIEKNFERISRPIRFIIVDNTRMFTKPEYWDRVVAIFTTGHTWQFNNYQWNSPQELFQRCKGYYFHFAGDSVPQHVQQWNVEKVELDKNKRFKDVEVVRYFWHSLEKELISRGYR
ncbi:AAC_HP2_G0038580.mRNA.1.CDS.1 [Saccharomyces cerevisiae]|uniref:Accessory factor associated with RNA polymerase II n=1 Tax=Saccharomyces pastorianus TaxID=27292 RepID=A0A6C1DWB1_SACPS|nr:Cdc73p [Saccharomyces cerevisiae FostersO]QID81348.1 accessory factor associated with RNA polymerase II [Saccharomyces pastorianus]CAI5309252.1 AAC_HP2_G0038580.mRNA.1.CDS.1 [Saccharomyces cerevisiae]CAI6677057.1 AAC_HP2_G0038580.mRNA.1.CDS.1 [Saccharomyces cerevisiae]CAI6682579.1 AAC_HP1_G0039640.mRNA.1.CDS.1 [Saccharomyces cerevisiae]